MAEKDLVIPVEDERMSLTESNAVVGLMEGQRGEEVVAGEESVHTVHEPPGAQTMDSQWWCRKSAPRIACCTSATTKIC